MTALALALVLAVPPAGRPNVLLAIADDWSFPHAGAYGDPAVRTPTFDRLAREGVLFTRAFVSAPSCTPSRGAILTGQHFARLEQGANLWGTLPAKFVAYPDLFRQAGYATGCSRKAWGPGQLAPGGRKQDPAGPRFADLPAFLAARPKGQPFCFWWGSSDPHRPYDPGSGAKAGIDPATVQVPACLPDDPAVRADLADYLFEVQRFDRELGGALRLLEQSGELDNTVVVVTADNGLPFPRAKANLYDPGTRVPLVVRWPKGFAGGRTSDALVSLTDLAPTFLQAAGLTPPADMTGRSLLPLLRGEADKPREAVLVGKERHTTAQERGNAGGYPCRGLRTADHLFVRNFEPNRWPNGVPDGVPAHIGNRFSDCDDGPSKAVLLARRAEPGVRPLFDRAFAKRPAEELYDLRTDPDQLVNLAADPRHADTRRELAAKLEAALAAVADPRAGGKPAAFDGFPYYGKQMTPGAGH